jgi:hypothetical protein
MELQHPRKPHLWTHDPRRSDPMTTDTDPVRVDALDFRRSAPQLIHDGWRNTDRICRYRGACSYCGTRTYAFDDGENDPRGMLGDHAADALDFAEHLDPADAAEVRRVNLPELPACFGCMNDYDRYHALMDKARRRARRLGADI